MAKFTSASLRAYLPSLGTVIEFPHETDDAAEIKALRGIPAVREDFTKAELVEKARERGISGAARLSKDKLVEAVEDPIASE